MKSFLNQYPASRGLNNNNPGNLRLTLIEWEGKVPNSQNTDKFFEQFTSVEYGLRALYTDIINDIANKGQNTLYKLLNSYAPAHENNTNAYIDFVAGDTLIDPAEPIILNKANITAIVKAIVKMEIGSTHAANVTNTMHETAFNMLAETTKARLSSQAAEPQIAPVHLAQQAAADNPIKTILIIITATIFSTLILRYI